MDELPIISKTRETQLHAWPAILSILFEIATSDDIPAIFGMAGLTVNWRLAPPDAFSHLTRKRAYRPRVETAFSLLEKQDKVTVQALTVAELVRKYPAQVPQVIRVLSRIGWSLKIATDQNGTNQNGIAAMKRNKELQKLLLRHVRDGVEPAELVNYSEAEQVYNSALLVNDGLIEGQAIRGSDGSYASVVMINLTSAGHDFLEADSKPPVQVSSMELPPALSESIQKFRKEHPDPKKVAFLMMRFGSTKAHDSIVDSIRSGLAKHGIKPLRADDKDYHDDLFWNILTYIYGCGFGIAVFERIEQEEFNPNVALEVGYMLALRKPVLLLKDKTLKNLNTDLIGKLYKAFDLENMPESIGIQLTRWLKDRDII